MNEIIKIEVSNVGSEEVQTVNARDLHEFLESKQDFSTWIKNRINQYNFIEDQDFTTCSTEKWSSSGTKYIIEYHISIDMAKELSMVERNERGKQARQYFIECEKKLRHDMDPILALENPVIMRDLLLVYCEKLIEKDKVIEEQKPKVEFYDKVIQSETTINISDAAKILNYKNIGRNKLFAILRDKKVLDKNNQPYQKYVNGGYFKVTETSYDKGDSTVISLKTVVYQKGLDFIRKLLDKE